jgi:hypothetical protein
MFQLHSLEQKTRTRTRFCHGASRLAFQNIAVERGEILLGEEIFEKFHTQRGISSFTKFFIALKHFTSASTTGN